MWGMKNSAATVVWNGTQQESADLVNAIARNCECQFGLMGVRLVTCPSHESLMHDQRWLNWCLFLRRTKDNLQRFEWYVDPRDGS